jgi:hypothetical protein
MNEETLILRAMSMLRGSRTYEADARKHAAGGNSKAGSALSLFPVRDQSPKRRMRGFDPARPESEVPA